MLHPDLNDLLELRHQAHSLGLASHHPVNSVLCGLYSSVFRGQGMDFEEVREYQQGDEIRNMDWRVTARTNTPHLKVFREERQRSVLLCVDISARMQFGTRGTFKSIQAAKAAALLGWAASTSQDRVGGVLYGAGSLRYFRPSREHRTVWRILQALTQAKASERSEDGLGRAMDKLAHAGHGGSVILLIGDFNRETTSLEQRFAYLRQHHDLVVLPIDDPADREIPAMGRVLFKNRDGVRLELDTDSESGQAAYREQWDSQRNHLQVMCRRFGIDLIPLSTQEDVHLTLVKGLRRRMQRMLVR
ncbi:DUF58 domain-containing protein [Candidatus Venteria ishoeyi]|uniref:DUF58 domain-containing protein n=1 Tax=Candidatus Venteria ishoeyi TaxID=1899563 RepID=A0A1H6FC47_9GAMM|nr:DUF58 domain-containing protein [Candidatus Venteria ishoeyi]MDM8545750.1 DUF58 domain-containing protein [Candidatus Venteria ishoeyi]SEH07648.1 Uncharacterised protein [Candidatus Venteria ishoeyi]